MMKKIKIIAVTGIRSEYELLYPVLNEIRKKDNLKLDVIVTGAHNSDNFGYTINDIRNDGFKIAGTIENLLNSNSLVGKVKSAGILLSSLPEMLNSVRPNLVIALGDREEPLITAIACNYLNIPFAHIAGGDRAFPETGDADEGVRHATTKLAHLHFAMMKEHADRLLKLGEEKWRVFTVGNPGLDRIRLTKIISKKTLSRRLCIDLEKRKNIVVIQHVINQEAQFAKIQMEATLKALSSIDANVIIIYPNSDPGSLVLIETINAYLIKNMNFHAFKNLPRLEFVNLLRNADLLIGNSSAGILEAPFLKLATINVGERQKQRLHADNVLFAPFNENSIIKMINTALYDKRFITKVKQCESIYGDGYSGKRIADIISKEIKYNFKLLSKDITY
jgi:GDP/UDP-N,N'-diacetylbacillosamine 2-epimerase (hydrolysing)